MISFRSEHRPHMTIPVTDTSQLVLPLSARLRRQAGIKAGDRLQVKVLPRTITITAVETTHKATKAESAAIREGEAALASGQSVGLVGRIHRMAWTVTIAQPARKQTARFPARTGKDHRKPCSIWLPTRSPDVR